MGKVCLQTFRNNRRSKNWQTSRANNLRILSNKKVKLSGRCFCINTNIKDNSQIDISVLLMWALLRTINL